VRKEEYNGLWLLGGEDEEMKKEFEEEVKGRREAGKTTRVTISLFLFFFFSFFFKRTSRQNITHL
jgi:hypothetical protein